MFTYTLKYRKSLYVTCIQIHIYTIDKMSLTLCDMFTHNMYIIQIYL